MTTVFSDDLFLKCDLFTVDKSRKIIATLKDPVSGRYIPDLLRQDGTGFLIGRLVDPVHIPEWLKSGTVLIMDTDEQNFRAALTFQPIAQSRIRELTDLLGDKVRFSYVVTSEFSDV